jgi:hypothetical protein
MAGQIFNPQASHRDSVEPSFARISAEDLLRAEGGCISDQEVADLLELENITIVEDWRRYRQIVAIKSDDETWMYPVWQFARKPKRVMLGIRDCLAELDSDDDWQTTVFFLSYMTRLAGKRPLDCLRAGKIEAAIKAARAIACSRAFNSNCLAEANNKLADSK